MKREINFFCTDDNYTLVEQGKEIFCINKQTLKFDSKKFYLNVYQGKSVNIELSMSEDNADGRGKYVFNWVNEIVELIKAEFPEECIEDDLENNIPKTNIIHLYEMAACAGDGFFMDENGVPFVDYKTTNMEADYAVTISGQSMEPKIQNGSVVLVKTTKELKNNEIGIFVFDGEVMCKRFVRRGRGVFLVPENKTFDEKKCTKESTCVILGRIIDVIENK